MFLFFNGKTMVFYGKIIFLHGFRGYMTLETSILGIIRPFWEVPSNFHDMSMIFFHVMFVFHHIKHCNIMLTILHGELVGASWSQEFPNHMIERP